MRRPMIGIACAALLTLVLAGSALAQNTETKTAVVQNADGSWTVVEYPVDKEVIVNLTPTTLIPGATGVARVKRTGDLTTINLDLKGLTGESKSYNLYTVDPTGTVTLLGPIGIDNGLGTFTTTTPLNQFMMVLSPDANVTAISPETHVVLRSAVPTGFAVLPLASSGERDGAAVGEKVSAATTSGTTPAYSAPLLGIPGFRRGTDTQMKINFSGEMTGARANVSIEPRRDGPSTIVMRFHELKAAPANKVYVVWAVTPDNKLVRLGQIVNTGKRNEAEIKTETSLPDFGLFLTLEDTGSATGTGEGSTPTGTIVGTLIK